MSGTSRAYPERDQLPTRSDMNRLGRAVWIRGRQTPEITQLHHSRATHCVSELLRGWRYVHLLAFVALAVREFDMTVKKLGNDNTIVEFHAHGARRFTRNLICIVTAMALIISLSTACRKPQAFSNAESNEHFDAPIRIETVELGASPYYPDPEDSPPTSLSCYYFPTFMVKEHYLGGKGAEWMSVLLNAGGTPECTSSHEPGERIIEYPEWEGYFMGVKGNLVFFDGNDTFNGGLPFAVYDSSNGKKIFEDSAYYEHGSSLSHVEVVATSAGHLLRYLRVAVTDCNLNSEGTACWNEIKAEYSLRSDDIPICTGYERIADLVGTDQVESVIAYPVEVVLSGFPSIQSVAGPVRCWPSH